MSTPTTNAPARLNRAQKQAQTKQALIDAATSLIVSSGLQGTSIDKIASAAGFTKGAFYANFANKDELFAAMLADHFRRRVDEMELALEGELDPLEKASKATDGFMKALAGDREHALMALEFTAYAARDPRFRGLYSVEVERMRQRITELLQMRVRELSVEPRLDVATFVRIAMAAVLGQAIEQLVETKTPQSDLELHIQLLLAGALGSWGALGPSGCRR